MKTITLFTLFIFLRTIGFGQGTDSSQAIFVADSPNSIKPVLKGKNIGAYFGEIKYSSTAINNKVEGRVIVEFIVEKDGTISNIKTVKGIGSGCDEEAEGVVAKTNGKWIPGKSGEQIVRYRYLQPVFFRLPPQNK